MSRIEYETDINAQVEKVYEYYTNPDNIKEAWPRDVVKESETVSGSKSEEGSEIKVKGEYMGKKEEMKLQVVDKEPNRKLVTKQTDGPFKKWESIQEFHGSGNTTHTTHTIEYELPIRNGYFIFLAVIIAPTVMTMSFLQTQTAEAQTITGDVRRCSDRDVFEGEQVGTVSIDSTGRRTNVS